MGAITNGAEQHFRNRVTLQLQLHFAQSAAHILTQDLPVILRALMV